jgi:hypothetical protein
VTSSRKKSQSGDRPIVERSAVGMKCSPVLPPPERTTSAGPSVEMSSRGPSSSASSSGVYVCVVSVPPSSLTSSAPHFEQ